MTETDRLDAVVQRYRAELASLDRELVRLVNTRLERVEELRRHKTEHGIPFLDPDREASMLEHLTRLNEGPLSESGVAELYRFVLDLIKRELRP